MAAEQGQARAQVLPRTGQVFGWVLVAVFVGFAVLTALSGWPVFMRVGSWFVLGAVLSYAAWVRPAVRLGASALELRAMASATRVPLAAIDRIAVQQTMAVFVGDRVYRSAALGRPFRDTAKSALTNPFAGGKRPAVPVPSDWVDVLIDQLMAAVDEDRARLGIRPMSAEAEALAEQVRRIWSWPMVSLLVGSIGWVVLSLISR